MYKLLLRPIFFLFNPERVHHNTFIILKWIYKIPGIKHVFQSIYCLEDRRLERELFGLKFKNPVGLAAGFDKNARLYNTLADFGFGFIEIGTVTPQAQTGNPKKRLFRLQADQAIINRMGFNNEGVEAVIENLKKNQKNVIIGGNIGKNTATKPADYTADYRTCFRALHPYVDYFVLNVSCPNVQSHAKLNDKDYLESLIAAVQAENKTFEKQKPILLKIGPDLNATQLDEIVDLMKTTRLEGVIASNTSTQRTGLKTSQKKLEAIGHGGLSGHPIKAASTRVIRYLSERSQKAFPIIGVGGIHSAQDALDKIDAGADLVQIYTGFIYEGPQLIKTINKALLAKEVALENNRN